MYWVGWKDWVTVNTPMVLRHAKPKENSLSFVQGVLSNHFTSHVLLIASFLIFFGRQSSSCRCNSRSETRYISALSEHCLSFSSFKNCMSEDWIRQWTEGWSVLSCMSIDISYPQEKPQQFEKTIEWQVHNKPSKHTRNRCITIAISGTKITCVATCTTSSLNLIVIWVVLGASVKSKLFPGPSAPQSSPW